MSFTIMRTGIGSSPSISTIKTLQKLGVKVIGVDSNPLSVGFYFAETGYCVPKADAPDYIPVLLEICKKEKVNAILPAVDEELIVLANHRDEFKEIGVFVVVANKEVIETCLDKFKTYRFFVENNIPTPTTADALKVNLKTVTYPKIIKPCFGRGQQDVYKVNNQRELDFFREYVKKPLLQDYIEGQEYTIDLLADFNGKVLCLVPRKRLGVESGVSIKGITTYKKEIIALCLEIVKKLGITGPANIQCFMAGDKIFFTEINLRLAGGVALSIAAGSNILVNLVKLLKGEKVNESLDFEENLLMLRYWAEEFIEKDEWKNYFYETLS
ncbi:MAG: ATP-grasp domain-containing protein [Nitrospirota bacterium]